MSKIAENKAWEAYPKALSPYYDDHILDRNVNCRVGYIKGYDQAMQDFLNKACEWILYHFTDSSLYNTHTDEEIKELFKNYMQDESEN